MGEHPTFAGYYLQCHNNTMQMSSNTITKSITYVVATLLVQYESIPSEIANGASYRTAWDR